MTGDRRLRFKGLHIQIHPSTSDDQSHGIISDFICFISILYETVSLSHSGLLCSFSGQRILSINLDMSLSCLASLNSSTVSQFKRLPLIEMLISEMSLTFSQRMLFWSVPFMRFNPHLCPLHLSALFFPPMRERE